MTSMTRCSRYKGDCARIDKLRSTESLLDSSSYDTSSSRLVLCPMECGQRLYRVDVEPHLRHVCPRRRVVCQFCCAQMSSDAMEKHEGNCPLETIWCENKCGARLQRRHLSNHSQSECHKRTVSCVNCQKKFVYETLQDHYHQCPRFPLVCPNRCDVGKLAREEMPTHLSQDCTGVIVPCPFREVGCKHVCTRFSMEHHVVNSSRIHLSLVCSLAVDQRRQIEELTQRLASVTSLHAAHDGSFLWKIAGFKSKAGQEVKSGAFYTSMYGYRLRASVFPTGNGSGEGTHLSVYIRVVTGDYDALLDWPFRLPVTIILYDQSADLHHRREHIVESLVPNASWKQFQRPVSDGSPGSPGVSTGGGFGYPRFLSLDRLDSGSYVRDDTIFIKFKVELSAPIVEHC